MFINPLIEAVHLAFSEHRPLILSPDAIWLTIAQGFGHHVHLLPEALRQRLVRHAGRKRLEVRLERFDDACWQDWIANFSAQIRQASDPVVHETLLCDFSTTSPAMRTASEVAMMDSYEPYFEYVMICICGIPKITLEGTPDDWRRMRARIEVIATFGLERWVSRLRPILNEFVRTAEGDPESKFWKAIYKPEPVYGGKVATGWIADLFPYLGDAPKRRPNHVFHTARTDWMVPVNQGVAPSSFPSGLSSVPVRIERDDGSAASIDLMAGLVGVGQSSVDNGLFPVISWSVVGTDTRVPSRS